MMGFISDMGRLARQTKELRKDYDPGQQSRDAVEKMREANAMLEARTQGMADGVPATASVVSVGATQGMLNMDPMLPVELLVTQPGMPPRPVTSTMVVRTPVTLPSSFFSRTSWIDT